MARGAHMLFYRGVRQQILLPARHGVAVVPYYKIRHAAHVTCACLLLRAPQESDARWLIPIRRLASGSCDSALYRYAQVSARAIARQRLPPRHAGHATLMLYGVPAARCCRKRARACCRVAAAVVTPRG